VFIQRKRGRAAGTTLQAPYTMLRLHIHFSAPHLIIPYYSQMSSPLSECPPDSARARQLDLGFWFVLFSSGGARGIQESCQGGVPVTD